MQISNEVIQFIRRQRMGYVATVNADGTPNLSPKGTLTALDASQLVFANIASPNTMENIQRGSKAEVNVLDIFSRRGYRFRCHLQIFDYQQQMFEKLLKFYLEIELDLSPYPVEAFVLLQIESWSELRSPAYFNGSSEASLQEFYYDYYKQI
ncbi:MAG: pyridoxamine 5'-phosphate oxidase family protein [Saprospiraceae bacterium]